MRAIVSYIYTHIYIYEYILYIYNFIVLEQETKAHNKQSMGAANYEWREKNPFWYSQDNH